MDGLATFWHPNSVTRRYPEYLISVVMELAYALSKGIFICSCLLTRYDSLEDRSVFGTCPIKAL